MLDVTQAPVVILDGERVVEVKGARRNVTGLMGLYVRVKRNGNVEWCWSPVGW
jgi:hypothetical protein